MAAAVEAALAAERQKRQRTGPLPEIPAISLAPFREGTDEGKMKVASEWDRACREVGFIKVIDHGVPRQVINECWEATEAFFERPLEEKLAVGMTEDCALSLHESLPRWAPLLDMIGMCVPYRPLWVQRNGW